MYRPYNNLRARIYQYGYTAGSLAAQIGLSPQQMSARMRGRAPFRTGEIAAIGEILNFSDNDYYTIFFLPELSSRRCPP